MKIRYSKNFPTSFWKNELKGKRNVLPRLFESLPQLRKLYQIQIGANRKIMMMGRREGKRGKGGNSKVRVRYEERP